ncbi:MaoC/PaaZ C-terminal domain-containing protein [Kribbella yunnanensis]|uniref:MaoC/PaaZ C-terminal domain-containing protein n=1 Tax=Kribbella yunnanensis TaxID=190194 RepID=A0ABN2IKD0_9ACTN
MDKLVNADRIGRRVTGQGDVYWEDLSDQQRLVGPGMTITDAHLVNWAGLTGDWVSLHLDAEYAATTPFGARIAHGPLTLSLSFGLLTQTGVFGNVSAWLGVDEVRARRPVLIGDTIHPEAVLRTTRSTSKPEAGLWTFDYETINQRGEVVMTFSGSFLVRRRTPKSSHLTTPEDGRAS